MRLCTLTVMNTQPADCPFLLEPQKLGDADQSILGSVKGTGASALPGNYKVKNV